MGRAREKGVEIAGRNAHLTKYLLSQVEGGRDVYLYLISLHSSQTDSFDPSWLGLRNYFGYGTVKKKNVEMLREHERAAIIVKQNEL